MARGGGEAAVLPQKGGKEPVLWCLGRLVGSTKAAEEARERWPPLPPFTGQLAVQRHPPPERCNPAPSCAPPPHPPRRTGSRAGQRGPQALRHPSQQRGRPLACCRCRCRLLVPLLARQSRRVCYRCGVLSVLDRQELEVLGPPPTTAQEEPLCCRRRRGQEGCWCTQSCCAAIWARCWPAEPPVPGSPSSSSVLWVPQQEQAAHAASGKPGALQQLLPVCGAQLAAQTTHWCLQSGVVATPAPISPR